MIDVLCNFNQLKCPFVSTLLINRKNKKNFNADRKIEIEVGRNYFSISPHRNTMTNHLEDFFEHRRYRLSKILMRFTGQWPLQEQWKNITLMGLAIALFIIGIPAQIRYTLLFRHHWEKVIASMGPLLVHSACVVKVFNTIFTYGKVRMLLEHIYYDWNKPMGPEAKILAKHADDGRLFVIIYTVWLYSSTISFLILSWLPYVLLVTGRANMSSAHAFVIPVYYRENDVDYYTYLQTFLVTGIVYILSISIASDGMFVVFIQHGCGLFAAVSYRLEHLVDNDNLNIDLYPRLIDDTPFWTVVDCIKKHNEAINVVASAYTWSFFFVLGINMMAMSFTGLQMLLGVNPDSVDDAIRQFLFAASQLLHLLFENAFSQRLTDHSLDVFTGVTRSKWYSTSMRTRKLIVFMLMRSIEPWELKAGNMITMSMQNFSSIVRTSVSYLTIFGSIE